MALSVMDQLSGRTVLLTGGTGFIGSVVLEKLLRSVNVRKVYLVIRHKKGMSASKRLQQLVSLPLFQGLQQQAAGRSVDVFQTVQALEGDITEPGLGLGPEDATRLKAEVDVVIHCAADIMLNPGIQTTLQHNYLSTKHLLQLAFQMTNLRCFLHMSTYGVCFGRGWNDLAQEQLYPLPLQLQKQPVNHEQFVREVITMQPADADKVLTSVANRMGFGSTTYAFGKVLTEQLVEEYDLGACVSKVIVRPSMVTATAAEPYPGYLAGYAGLISYIMAYALGLFPSQHSIAWSADLLLDTVPCDVVASLTLAAAAAGLEAAGTAATSQRAVIYHATSSHTRTLSMYKMFQLMQTFWNANPVSYALPGTRYKSVDQGHQPVFEDVEEAKQQLLSKVQQQCRLLANHGQLSEAKVLKTTFAAYDILNRTHYNRSIVCSVDNVKALADRLSGREQQQSPILWEPSDAELTAYMSTFQAAVRKLLLGVKKHQPSRSVNRAKL